MYAAWAISCLTQPCSSPAANTAVISNSATRRPRSILQRRTVLLVLPCSVSSQLPSHLSSCRSTKHVSSERPSNPLAHQLACAFVSWAVPVRWAADYSHSSLLCPVHHSPRILSRARLCPLPRQRRGQFLPISTSRPASPASSQLWTAPSCTHTRGWQVRRAGCGGQGGGRAAAGAAVIPLGGGST